MNSKEGGATCSSLGQQTLPMHNISLLIALIQCNPCCYGVHVSGGTPAAVAPLPVAGGRGASMDLAIWTSCLCASM